MTYLLLEVQAIVNAPKLQSRPAPKRTWRDRASDAEAGAVFAALDKYLAVRQVGAEIGGAL